MMDCHDQSNDVPRPSPVDPRGADLHLNRFFAAIALGAAAGLAPGIGHASEGEAAFKARCGQCHVARDIRQWGRQHADAAARQAWLDQFLRRHNPPPQAERTLIIDYIQSAIAAQGAAR